MSFVSAHMPASGSPSIGHWCALRTLLLGAVNLRKCGISGARASESKVVLMIALTTLTSAFSNGFSNEAALLTRESLRTAQRAV